MIEKKSDEVVMDMIACPADAEASPLKYLKEEDLPPFYFLVVFWGGEHRNYFIDLCLSSLLAPGNIPSLKNLEKSQFLISTTAEDWEALQGDPLFQQLSELVQTVLIEIPFPGPTHNKMNVMSSGHRRLTKAAYEANSLGINLNPDTIFCDGTMARLAQLAMQGKKLVFHSAIRFEMEGTIGEMSERFLWEKGKPLTIQNREGADIALRHRHSELKACNFDSPAFWDFPVHTFLDVPGHHAIDIHSFSWAALLVDYGHIDEHDTSTFDEWTLDGDYIFNNFQSIDANRDVHVVRDSDDIFIISVTPRDEANVPDTPQKIKSFPVIGNWYKGLLINEAFKDDRIDPMKKIIFLEPVFMHSGDLSPAFAKTEKKINKTLCYSLSVIEGQWGGVTVADAINKLRVPTYVPVDRREVPPSKAYNYISNKHPPTKGILLNFYPNFKKGLIYSYIYFIRTFINVIRKSTVYSVHYCRKTIWAIIWLSYYVRSIALACIGNKTEIKRIFKRLGVIYSSIFRAAPK